MSTLAEISGANNPAIATLDPNKANGNGNLSAADQSKTRLNETFDNFLKLLLAQLKAQDPTSPMDTDKFTQQIVNLTQAEQSVATNKNLEAILGELQAQGGSNLINNTAVNYLGKEVTIDNSKVTHVSGGQSTFNYKLPEDAAELNVRITDSNGGVAFFGPATGKGAGDNSFIWDGKDNFGNVRPSGDYTIEFTAFSPTGQALAADTKATGKVTAVDFENGDVKLHVNGAIVDLSKVSSVRDASDS